MRRFTLAFDVYGTLINTAGVVKTLEQMMGDKASLFSEIWRSKQLEYSFRRALSNTYLDFSVCTRDALEYCDRYFRCNLRDDQKKALLSAYDVLPAFSDVKQGLEELKKANHQLYAFSNGSREAVTKLLVSADIVDYFDGIISVKDVETFKPNPKAYEHFVEESHSDKSNNWLISSNPFDVIGSISYGFRSAWVRRNSNAVFDPWTNRNAGVIEPTIIINSIADLLAAFKERE